MAVNAFKSFKRFTLTKSLITFNDPVIVNVTGSRRVKYRFHLTYKAKCRQSTTPPFTSYSN